MPLGSPKRVLISLMIAVEPTTPDQIQEGDLVCYETKMLDEAQGPFPVVMFNDLCIRNANGVCLSLSRFRNVTWYKIIRPVDLF